MSCLPPPTPPLGLLPNAVSSVGGDSYVRSGEPGGDEGALVKPALQGTHNSLTVLQFRWDIPGGHGCRSTTDKRQIQCPPFVVC